MAQEQVGPLERELHHGLVAHRALCGLCWAVALVAGLAACDVVRVCCVWRAWSAVRARAGAVR